MVKLNFHLYVHGMRVCNEKMHINIIDLMIFCVHVAMSMQKLLRW